MVVHFWLKVGPPQSSMGFCGVCGAGWASGDSGVVWCVWADSGDLNYGIAIVDFSSCLRISAS